MDVTIQGVNMRVHETVEAYARRKLDRLDRYLPGISEIRLDLSHEQTRRSGPLTIAEITVRHQRGAILRAEERVQNGDFQTAINQAIDKMYRRIERFKGRRTNWKGKERFAATAEELSEAEAIPDAALYQQVVAEEAAETEPEVVRRKTVTVTAMTEEEAIEQMELLGHTFFMFYNAESGGVNVLYKREAGGYGVLVPNLE